MPLKILGKDVDDVDNEGEYDGGLKTMNQPMKWVAEIAHVREVSLLGSADLGFWTDHLRPEGLVPTDKGGKSQILVIAAEMKFMGIRFREASFSVLVDPPRQSTHPDSAFLVQAFNSCRFFAFSERVFFSTPYTYGDVRVSASVPCSIHIYRNGEMAFRAERHANGHSQAGESPDRAEAGWEGPIFLHRKRPGAGGRVFFGRLNGQTDTYPFRPDKDTVTIQPSPGSNIFRALVDSGFAIDQWIVRQDASHSKSKTFQRSEVFPEPVAVATSRTVI